MGSIEIFDSPVRAGIGSEHGVLRRQRPTTPMLRFGLADSSPIAGYDWLWSQFIEIPRSQAFRTYRAVCQLQASIEAWTAPSVEAAAAGDDQVEQWWKAAPPALWLHWAKIMRKNIVEAIEPPNALGSGCRGLVHKAALMVYGWRLGPADISDVSEVSHSYVSHTSEMGVELGLPDLSTAEVKQ